MSTRYWSSCEECIIIGTYSQRHLRSASQTESTRPVLEALGDSSAPTRERTTVLGSLFRPALLSRFASIYLRTLERVLHRRRPPISYKVRGRYVRASILSNIHTHWSLAEATSGPGLPHSLANRKLEPYPESTQCVRVMMLIFSFPLHDRMITIPRSYRWFSAAVYAF